MPRSNKQGARRAIPASERGTRPRCAPCPSQRRHTPERYLTPSCFSPCSRMMDDAASDVHSVFVLDPKGCTLVGGSEGFAPLCTEVWEIQGPGFANCLVRALSNLWGRGRPPSTNSTLA